VGKRYKLSTKFKELPIKTQLLLSWSDPSSRLLGFSGRCALGGAFSPGADVYVETEEGRFARCKSVSNSGEIVLEFKELTEPPEFIRRKAVRVEPEESEPVFVHLKANGVSIRTKAKDISETGVGILIPRNDKSAERLISLIQENPLLPFELEVELPRFGTAHAKGSVRNVSLSEEGLYIRVGFEAEFSPKDQEKVRRYVLERQRQIVKSLRML